MGIRCSLLGHDFAEAELDREREERGEEVVITIREVKTCERCGTEQVLSENTEVRPVEPMEDIRDDADEPSAASSAPNGTGETDAEVIGADAEGDTGATDVDAAGDDAGATGTSAPGDDESAFGGTAAGNAAAETDAESDDGVIIDGDEAPERTAGEWPDATDTRVDERDVPAEAGPEVAVEADDDADAEGSDAGAADANAADGDAGAAGVDAADGDEGAEILGGGSSEESPEPDTSGVERTGDGDGGATGANAAGDDAGATGANAAGGDTGAAGVDTADDDEETEILDGDATAEDHDAQSAGDWPDPAGEDHGFDAEPGNERTELEFSGLAPEGGRDVGRGTPSEAPSLDVGDGTAFVCPECGFSKPADQASLRAGDICPECRKGYLGEE